MDIFLNCIMTMMGTMTKPEDKDGDLLKLNDDNDGNNDNN